MDNLIFKRDHPLYATWVNMRQRCNNPHSTSYPYYGGMGVRVDDRWNDSKNGFWNFVDDMGLKPDPSLWLSRHDVDGPYSLENCYWGERKEVALKSRRGLKLKVNAPRGVRKHIKHPFRGEELSLGQISKLTGVRTSTIRERLQRGWDLEQAATIPAHPVQSRKVLKWNRERLQAEHEARQNGQDS